MPTHRVLPRGVQVSLVLDLDETLVHASLEFMEAAHHTFNVHFHSLVADGVFVGRRPEVPFDFVALPPPTPEEVMAIRRTGQGFNPHATQAIRAVDRRGLERLCRYILPYARGSPSCFTQWLVFLGES